MSRKKKEYKYHYTYRITNILEKKYYYGVHSCDCLPKEDIGVKYFSSSKNKAFKEDMKNNPQNYKYKVIKIFSTRVEALEHEVFLHNKFDVGVNSLFYNGIKQGTVNKDTSGLSTYVDKEGNKYFISVSDERVLSGTLKSYFSGENNGMYGNTHTPEAIEKIKIAREKQGSNVWNAGKTNCYTEETKMQISETLTGRIFVSKDGKNKNIYPEELEYYLSLGYERKVTRKKKNTAVRLYSEDFPEGILIEKENVQEYLDNGYYKKKFIFITKDDVIKKIELQDIDLYIDDGWIKGLKIERKNGLINTKAMHHPTENKTKYINIEDIEEYLQKGFILGGAKRK